MEFDCPNCAEVILVGDDAIIAECPSCSQRIAIEASGQVTPPLPAVLEQTAAINSEKEYFGRHGVTVTNKRIIVDGKTYALNQVASVGVEMESFDILSEKTLLGISRKAYNKVLFTLASISGVLVILFLLQANTYSLTGLFLIWAAFGFCKLITAMPTGHVYWVMITTAAGKEKAFRGATNEQSKLICDAINEAIVDA